MFLAADGSGLTRSICHYQPRHGRTSKEVAMQAPTIRPVDREASDVQPPASYLLGERVWVFQRRWLPGVVEAASPMGVRVRHQVRATATATGVNDFRPDQVMSRTEHEAIDRQLTEDRGLGRPIASAVPDGLEATT
jgi:hypothetical protein